METARSLYLINVEPKELSFFSGNQGITYALSKDRHDLFVDVDFQLFYERDLC